MCSKRGIPLHKKNFFLSMVHLLGTGRKPPVILVDGQPVCSGRVPSTGELSGWLRG